MLKKVSLGSGWMIIAAFLFATMSILVKNAATHLHMNEYELAFWRSLLPALVIFGTTLARKKTLKTPFFILGMHSGLIEMNPVFREGCPEVRVLRETHLSA